MWDDANRLTDFSNTEHSSEDATYNYDDAGQLKGANRSGVTADERDVYDENGNRVAVKYADAPVYEAGWTPIGEWQFDQDSGTSVSDTSGNGHSGSISGSPTWEADSPIVVNGDYSLLLNTNAGTGDYVTLGSDLVPSENFTVSLWFKAEDIDDSEHSETNQTILRRAAHACSSMKRG